MEILVFIPKPTSIVLVQIETNTSFLYKSQFQAEFRDSTLNSSRLEQGISLANELAQFVVI